MWPIEARNAAIANTYFVGANNRVGTVSCGCVSFIIREESKSVQGSLYLVKGCQNVCRVDKLAILCAVACSLVIRSSYGIIYYSGSLPQ